MKRTKKNKKYTKPEQETVLRLIRCLDCGIFPGTIMFSCGFTYDRMIEELVKQGGCEEWIYGLQNDKELMDQGNCFGLYRGFESPYSDGQYKRLYYIIITEPFTFTDFEYAKLAHEIIHIIQFHLPDILDRNREYEAEAYLHTHIMMQCLNALRNNNE